MMNTLKKINDQSINRTIKVAKNVYLIDNHTLLKEESHSYGIVRQFTYKVGIKKY